ncbi:putative tyrosyl-DNA phosphodiesterase [Eremomyces bilateralis CBS 781.70]|uniref:Tyrosyl-DNA phosphodiesterase n=1 Tax=Eremomyces bilateralis CBS 781.70 TaxID=1392243 RepID=A0A6G1G672_9PEZI|nr:putative tyrosyl-DNA phosphodiesterase [Eremomyces bilateralis CBS 781.70]KAF1813329.1 putative tyrosyl-DNA phosphodiesterase [Eremomyces bilateralis CBS 781.70]
MDRVEGGSSKRRRLNEAEGALPDSSQSSVNQTRLSLASLHRVISPPRQSRGQGKRQESREPGSQTDKRQIPLDQDHLQASPIHLTKIRDLPDQKNINAVSLKDIICDPLIKECWTFNYLTDIKFVVSNLDPDVRGSLALKIIHGFWKRDDERRQRLTEEASRFSNVQLITAHMPEPFGTHHTKMIVLLRHDDCAQVVIHTANMIPFDWTNMTQAVWRSPLLPRHSNSASQSPQSATIGSGDRFKIDLIRYLKAYSGRLNSLIQQLENYDFSAIRAAFIGSVPCREKVTEANPSQFTSFGWPGIREILSTIPHHFSNSGLPNIVIQMSSVATLYEKWLENFFSALKTSAGPKLSNPTVHIVFPTPDEIRRSLDGYRAGTSIHMKLASVAQKKQLEMVRPMLCYWAGDGEGLRPDSSNSLVNQPSSRKSCEPAVETDSEAVSEADSEPESNLPSKVREAHRRRAAPHIKTYIRFSDAVQTTIDWAMITSANMSTQAWGAGENKGGEVRICSYEAGVVVWPGLFSEKFGTAQNEEGETASPNPVMVPVFGHDMPSNTEVPGNIEKGARVVGFRMPYDLPLVPYRKGERPWCPTESHMEPDWMGQRYQIAGTG